MMFDGSFTIFISKGCTYPRGVAVAGSVLREQRVLTTVLICLINPNPGEFVHLDPAEARLLAAELVEAADAAEENVRYMNGESTKETP